jgi:hypothetical protein
MPIFGQVWLWSSLAFLLGAVLCWLLVARPARNRVGELEAQLTTRARRASTPERPEQARRDDESEFARSVVPGLGDRHGGEDSEYLTRAYALRDNPPPPLPPERGRLASYTDPEPNRDFAPMPPQRDHEPQTVFSPFEGGLNAPPEHAPEPSFGAFDKDHEQDVEKDEYDKAYDDKAYDEKAYDDGGLSAPPETELADPPRATATQYIDVSAGSLTAPPEVPVSPEDDPDRGWFDDELDDDAAQQAPEEQPAVPRNRHQLVEPFEAPLADARLVDDDEEEPGYGATLDGASRQDREPRPVDEYDNGGTVFTQRTHPIPGELIRRIDEAGKDERRQEDGLVDDLADDPAEEETDRRERTVESEPVSPVTNADEDRDTGVSHPLTSPDPDVASRPELPQEQTEVVSAVREKPASDLPRRVPKQNRMTPGVAVRVEPTPNALPKRVPGKPRHQIPFGVEPSAQPEPAPAAAGATADPFEAPRSLFEPIVPAADEGAVTPPPPHRLRQGSGGGRGPFGPGSAMPLPGGASPSPEFTIKASVAALRYCTPESPQFGRTVAEVWFRTAADAERVGFRPVG